MTANASTTSTAASQTTLIGIDDLKKRYQASTPWALNGINLQIHEGECFGLLGPNGCGKTTMISILCGLVSATQGSINIHGINAKKYLRQNPRFLGLVPQELALYPTLTIRENLKFFAKMYGYSGRLMRQRIENCLQATGLNQNLKMLVGCFSGGMKRRANLALSLLHEPQLLILDEPTVNVDPQSRNMIFDTLEDLRQQGTTMIYTTHYLEEAQRLCDRTAIVDHGKVLCCDSPQQLINNTAGAEDLGQVFLQLTGNELRD